MRTTQNMKHDMNDIGLQSVKLSILVWIIRNMGYRAFYSQMCLPKQKRKSKQSFLKSIAVYIRRVNSHWEGRLLPSLFIRVLETSIILSNSWKILLKVLLFNWLKMWGSSSYTMFTFSTFIISEDHLKKKVILSKTNSLTSQKLWSPYKVKECNTGRSILLFIFSQSIPRITSLDVTSLFLPETAPHPSFIISKLGRPTNE